MNEKFSLICTNQDILQDLMEKAQNETLKCTVAHSFPLEKVRLAMRTFDEGKFIGKIVLKP
jgi:NADPH:quinone reductase-like Zn-dependent oxidoreductase